MKKARMNISHFCFTLFNLKIFGEIVTTKNLILELFHLILNPTLIFVARWKPAVRTNDSGFYI